MVNEIHASIIISVITFFGVVVSGYWTYKTKTHTRDINDAVNNRHLKADKSGEIPPKIYDLAIDNNLRATRNEQRMDELIAWKHGYDNSAFPNTDAIDKFVKRVECLECYKKKAEQAKGES